MKKNYKEIRFRLGMNIDDAMKEFEKYSVLVCGSFNGHVLYSDIDNVESAYLKVTGKPKDRSEEERVIIRLNYEEEEKKHNADIQELTKEFIARGAEILDLKYIKAWIECVKVRIKDIYKGRDFEYCLILIKELNNGGSFRYVKNILESQDHQGMSLFIVCSMVELFCETGPAFVSYIRSEYGI